MLRIFDVKMAAFKLQLLASWDEDGACFIRVCDGMHVQAVLYMEGRTVCLLTLRAGTFDVLGEADDGDDDSEGEEPGDDDMGAGD